MSRQPAFTELISTAEKAWVAISKRTPPDVASIDRVKAAVSYNIRSNRIQKYLKLK